MNAIKPLAETPDTVTLARADYDAMIEALEDRDDHAAIESGILVPREDCLPIELVLRIVAGESPIKIWREHRGLTAHALAAAAGVGKSYISEIETGKKPGSVDALAKIAKAIGVTIDDLVLEIIIGVDKGADHE